MLTKIKKTVSLLLAVCMVFSMMPVLSLSVFAAEEVGTAANPHEITTEEQLRGISGSAHYKLVNDIVLEESWTPIDSFSGTLDGNGKTISGLNVNSTSPRNGFIETLDTGGTVKDLTVSGSVSCLNTGNCGEEGTGGIVGKNSGTITGCEFHGTVSQKQGDNMCVAGIAGYNAGVISGCRNYGDITGISTGGSYNAVFVGGITGSNHGTIEISNCINEGNIFASAKNANTYVGNLWGSKTWKSNGAYAGGIAGDNDGSDAPGCENYGTVMGENSNAETKFNSIIKPTAIELETPVTLEDLNAQLPKTLKLDTTQGTRVVTVTWDTSSYDALKNNATYTFSGTVTLPSTVSNNNNVPLTTTITVTVGSGSVTPPTEPADYALYFKDGKLYKASVDVGGVQSTGEEYTEQKDKWSVEGDILTLKGLKFETTASNALVMGDKMTLSLQEDTESTLKSTANEGVGIFGEGGFTVSGNGTVKASGKYAIGTADLVIESGTIYATGTGANSVGLYGAVSSGKHSVVIKGGKVIASGEKHGIYGYGVDVCIEGGEIQAMGNDPYGALFVFNGNLNSSDKLALAVKGSIESSAETLRNATIYNGDVLIGSETVTGGVKIGDAFCKTVHIKTAPAHKHCACGSTESIGDHTTHQDVSYQPLDSSFTGSELSEGSYYLTEDITLNSDINISANVNLCLNGHTINVGDKEVTINDESAECNITDCKKTGSIQGNDSYLIRNSKGKTNMFGIAVNTTGFYGPLIDKGEMNVYGGSIKAGTTGILANSGVLNIYDGKITAPSNGVLAYDKVVVNITGGTIQATNSDDSAPADVSLNDGVKLYLGGTPTITKIWFNSYAGTSAQIFAKCDNQNYTGEPIQLKPSSLHDGAIGKIIVSDVTKGVNDTKFSLDSEKYYLKLDETNQTNLILGVADTTAPTGVIKVGENTWNKFLNNITFGLFFKETQSVEITAADAGSGVDTIHYYLADSEKTEEDLEDPDNWIEYKDSFNITPDNKYAIYAKLADNAGNTAYINTEGLVLDSTEPVIDGIEDGKTYCGKQSFTVTEENLGQVAINGTEASAADGKYTVSPAEGEQTIVVTDKAGNLTERTITVNDGHTWDSGKVTKKATTTEKGEKTYTCTVCGAAKTESIPALNETSKTGDDSNMWLWIALMLISGAGLTAAVAIGKKRKINR